MSVADNLSQDERRRLEALSQAIHYHIGSLTTRTLGNLTPEGVAATAAVFEQYIRKGEVPRRPEDDEGVN